MHIENDDRDEDKPEPIIDAQLEDVTGGKSLRTDATVQLYGNDTLEGFTTGNDTIPFEPIGGTDIISSAPTGKKRR